MSQSQMAVEAAHPKGPNADHEDRIDGDAQELLDVLHDSDCRAILDKTSADSLSVKELAETCDIPLSTTYRKIDLLTEIGLLEEEGIRLRRSGKHVSEYTTAVENVKITINTSGNTGLTFECRKQSPGTLSVGSTR